ncbi:MAG: hypothetical protein GKC10_05870 [Methanosarcinales archaeon]|nr:hypothetical protein [Methanosarcinales archaeon]
MSKAIWETKTSGRKVGVFALGIKDLVKGSVDKQVHDGDTANVYTKNYFGVRFLGVDTPEISYRLPCRDFLELSDEQWDAFLAHPFGNAGLEVGLQTYLRDHLGHGVAANHYRHAVAAREGLKRMIREDIQEMNRPEDTFEFFLSFASEVMDRYGRLLCFINRNQPEGSPPPTYNERLLQEGLAAPYMIWPNINPFRAAGSTTDAVIKPGTAGDLAEKDRTLKQAREWVAGARREGKGIFSREDQLSLQPFEVRFLADQRGPDRWVIDLGKNDYRLIPPQEYYTVPNLEDRLFVPQEYVPLFVEKGWKKGG